MMISSGLSDVFITNISGVAYRKPNTAYSYISMSMNTTSPSGANYAIQTYYIYDRDNTGTVKNQIMIETGTNRTTFAGYIILEYIKTTD